MKLKYTQEEDPSEFYGTTYNMICKVEKKIEEEDKLFDRLSDLKKRKNNINNPIMKPVILIKLLKKKVNRSSILQ